MPIGLRGDPVGLRQPALGPAHEPEGPPSRVPGLGRGPGPTSTGSRTIWHECITASGGPFLFGAGPTLADAMFAPVCTRIRTYDVKVGSLSDDYTATMLALPEMIEWTEEAKKEPEDVEELEMEF